MLLSKQPEQSNLLLFIIHKTIFRLGFLPAIAGDLTGISATQPAAFTYN